MKRQKDCVGLICSDIDFVEYFVFLLTSIKHYTLKAIWCSDLERSIQLAADNDIPSVSHTAYQLISRTDINTVIITGYPSHNALFYAQAQALQKCVICIGAVSLSIECAQLLNEIAQKYNASINVIYPLKYSTPLALIRSNLAKIGEIQNINLESTFKAKILERNRLYYDSNVMLQKLGHEFIDAVYSLCVEMPQKIAVAHRDTSSIVDHFRLRELESAHLQIAFGNIVASFHITVSNVDSINIRIRGTRGLMQLNEHILTIETQESQSVLWRGDGVFENVIKEGIMNALNSKAFMAGPSEICLVHCCSS